MKSIILFLFLFIFSSTSFSYGKIKLSDSQNLQNFNGAMACLNSLSKIIPANQKIVTLLTRGELATAGESRKFLNDIVMVNETGTRAKYIYSEQQGKENGIRVFDVPLSGAKTNIAFKGSHRFQSIPFTVNTENGVTTANGVKAENRETIIESAGTLTTVESIEANFSNDLILQIESEILSYLSKINPNLLATKNQRNDMDKFKKLFFTKHFDYCDEYLLQSTSANRPILKRALDDARIAIYTKWTRLTPRKRTVPRKSSSGGRI